MRTSIFIASLLFLLASVNAQETAKVKERLSDGNNAETFKSFTFDGAWCWFSDPRAVYHEGEHKRTYAGWIDSYGDIHIGFYDHNTQQIETKVLYDGLQIDDHNNPSILFDAEGHLMIFFTKHGRKDPIHLLRSKYPENINDWEEIKYLDLNDTIRYAGYKNSYTYTNPVRLSDEDNKLFLFWRGMDHKPNYSVSDDNGKTWSKGEIFILPDRKYKNRRPYLKVSSKGKDKIHFAFSDGHPRKESTNSVYYAYYQDGSLFHANGEKIKSLQELPLKPEEADLVYDAGQTDKRAWIWDIATDEDGQPVLVYATFPGDGSNHVYHYAKWDGDEWKNYQLVNSGKWFPKTPKDKTEREPHYSGGIVLDHENPDIIYLSVNRDSVFEMEKWETRNDGKTWRAYALTDNSDIGKNNVRPVAIRNAGEDNAVQVLWMTNTHYEHYSDYHASIKMDQRLPAIEDPFESQSVLSLMRRVADWQLTNPRRPHKLDWHYGAFYTGLMRLYETTGEERYLNEMINLGQKYDWELLDEIFHADRLTIGHVFADIYKIKKDPEMIDKTTWVMDMHTARRPPIDVTFEENPYRMEWWTWCDALYMAPPTFVNIYTATGEEDYLDYMNKHFWKTTDYLYSKADSLYFRDDRFFDDRSENGKKIFWCRGNGWVIAGIARMLEDLPSDYPEREKYIEVFRQMAYKLLSIQGDEGLWRASLIDPEYLPIGESSGSAFFCFALAWGINSGILPEEEFAPAVKKAWKALADNVNREGRLGYVQQVAGSPYEFYEYQSHVYASGAFLLAGSEMLKLTE